MLPGSGITEKPIDVVVVDDDVDSRVLFVALLEMHGCVVRAVATADEALDSVSRRLPDVLVTDLDLRSAHDGAWLARAMRADARASGVALIALTGKAAHSPAIAASFDAYLRKPVETVDFVERVLELGLAAREEHRRKQATPST